VWSRLQANHGMGLEAQELLRWHGAPVACIKKRNERWECSLLLISGISTEPLFRLLDLDLDTVKQMCEDRLVELGWENPQVRK
jgi:hypothetical protein